jgi:Ca-activated chloride channel homolog
MSRPRQQGSTMYIRHIAAVVLASSTALAPLVRAQAQQPAQTQPSQGEQQAGADRGPGERQSFRFRTGVELINVNATVTDSTGRFVPGLRKEDFRIFEDEQLQEISHFNSERVPVSLGIALDTSGSMDGEKMLAARDAIDRFLGQLLGPDDEVFLYRFDSTAELVQDWTKDRARVRAELGRMYPRGGTAMYDAVAEAVPLAQTGRNKKKALVVISDGNDTSSQTEIRALKRLIRESEVLVYAVGIDSDAPSRYMGRQPGGIMLPPRQPPRLPIPLPFPMPGRRRPPGGQPMYPNPPQPPRGGYSRGIEERVNVAALRDITDDSGGRTEIVRYARDLDPATSSIADELSKQYYIGYPAAAEKDGRWHAIRVEVRNGYRVRARRGYMASTS